MKNKSDLIYGIHAIEEALKAGKSIDKIQIAREAKRDKFDEIRLLARQSKVFVQYVPVDKLNRITGKNHQGVIAFVSPVAFCKAEDLLPGIFEKAEVPFILVLDGITDVRNFGAIVRTAESAGVHAVIIPDKGAARINSDAMKTSAGALNRVPICKASVLSGTIKFLKNSGLKVFGISEKTDNDLFAEKFTEPLALVLGSEETGISNIVLKQIDAMLKIPMKGEISSLNVSVAAGVAMYEVLKQREK